MLTPPRATATAILAGVVIFLLIAFSPLSTHLSPLRASTAGLLHPHGLTSSTTSSTTSSNVPLILYNYYETENARTNAEFFLQFGMHDAADWIFILNGPTDLDKLIPVRPNIRIVRRENKCMDLGGAGEVLGMDDGRLMREYKKFIIMNASIRGPFMPSWSDRCWTDAYLQDLSDEVKLVGMSYNCIPNPHVQSMILAMDSVGLATIYPLINTCFDNWAAAVDAELHIASTLWAAGYKTSTLMTLAHTKGYDPTTCTHPNLWFPKRYGGADIMPYDTIFMKAHLEEPLEDLEKWTAMHRNIEYSSYRVCRRPA